MNYKPRSIKLLLSAFLLVLLLGQRVVKSPSGMTSKHSILKRPPIQRVVGSKAQTAHEKLAADLVDTGKELLGKLYGYRGDLPRRADHPGFVSCVYLQYDIMVPRGSVTQAGYAKRIKREEILSGDLPPFRGRSRGSSRAGHMAIATDIVGGDPVMIHSTNSRDIIVGRLGRSVYLSSRHPSAGCVPEMSDLIEKGMLVVPKPKFSSIASNSNNKVNPVGIDRGNLLPETSVGGPI